MRDAGDGGQMQTTRQNRGMALAAADHGDETADNIRIHERGIRRGDFLGHDDAADGDGFQCHIFAFQQIAHQTAADIFQIFDAAGQVVVFHGVERLAELGDFLDHGLFGIDAQAADAFGSAARQTGVADQRQMHIQQHDDIFGGFGGQSFGFGLQFQDLLMRFAAGSGKTFQLQRHRFGRDGIKG